MADGTDRKLVLLRHAKSAWPDVPDHERPLGRRGQRDGPVMGRWLRAAGQVPDQVLCSTARRDLRAAALPPVADRVPVCAVSPRRRRGGRLVRLAAGWV